MELMTLHFLSFCPLSKNNRLMKAMQRIFSDAKQLLTVVGTRYVCNQNGSYLEDF